MDWYETLIIGAAVLIFFLLLLVVLYMMCHYTGQKGDYETEEAKRATDFTDNATIAFMYSPNSGLTISEKREWFI